MMNTEMTSSPVRALVHGWLALAQQIATANDQHGTRRLRVFLDCENALGEAFAGEDDFVQCVDDREDADVCIHVERDGGARRQHHLVRFIGLGSFACIEASASLPDARFAF
jgi:hypothetical protein